LPSFPGGDKRERAKINKHPSCGEEGKKKITSILTEWRRKEKTSIKEDTERVQSKKKKGEKGKKPGMIVEGNSSSSDLWQGRGGGEKHTRGKPGLSLNLKGRRIRSPWGKRRKVKRERLVQPRLLAQKGEVSQLAWPFLLTTIGGGRKGN